MSGMERLTQRAKKVLSLAHQEAERMRHSYIGTEHLLLGLIIEDGGVASRVLRELGLEVKRVTELVERLSEMGSHTGGKIDLSPNTQQVLQYAFEEAKNLGKNYVSTEHLLLGLIRLDDSIAMQVLRKTGINDEQIRRQTRRVLQEGSTPARQSTRRPSSRKSEKKGKTPMIDQLAVDLTNLAEEEKLDPVIGREMEIERVIQILARRTKNNPALMGEPGVGKTTAGQTSAPAGCRLAGRRDDVPRPVRRAAEEGHR